jgi:hypothetical protein
VDCELELYEVILMVHHLKDLFGTAQTVVVGDATLNVQIISGLQHFPEPDTASLAPASQSFLMRMYKR